MSKAFTRETDDVPERPTTRRQIPSISPGVPNYITATGARRLGDELNALMSEPAENRTAQQRIAELREILESVVVVEPPVAFDVVRFGASVIVRADDGSEARYRLVGADETDVENGDVSWQSPIARALLQARRGQRVLFRSPLGEEELEVVDITYDP